MLAANSDLRNSFKVYDDLMNKSIEALKRVQYFKALRRHSFAEDYFHGELALVLDIVTQGKYRLGMDRGL